MSPEEDQLDELKGRADVIRERLDGSARRLEDTDPIADVSSVGEIDVNDEDASDCLALIHRVRRRNPDCMADLLADPAGLSLRPGDADDLPKQIGRFQIRRLLGQGGFGLVFLAFDPELEREVALKVPRVEALLTEQTRERFLREAKAAAALDHPHIATVYESGRVGPICYIASAYYRGGSLADVVEREAPLAPVEAARLVAVLASAIQHAHSRGILHRDIKPANVLLDVEQASTVDGEMDSGGAREAQELRSGDDLGSRIFISDFGLAKVVDDPTHQTQTGALVGTPAYMSPEQADSRLDEISVASDVYALGCILYALLTGRPPFEGETTLSVLESVRSVDPVSPRRLRPEIPRDLDSICLKCLQKDPSARYVTAAALADDLGRYLNNEPIVARPVRNWERLLRTCRRRPLASSLAALVVTLVMLLAVGSTIASVMLAQANQDAITSLEEEILAKDKATKSETLAIRALYEARVQQARALRSSGQPGQRIESLKAIEAALRQRQRLDLSEADLNQARNEAAAALALVDLRLDKRWAGVPPLLSEQVAFDANVVRFARWERTGEVVVRRMQDEQRLVTLNSLGKESYRPHVRFSPNGQLLAVCGPDKNNDLRLHLWDLSQPANPILDKLVGGVRQSIAFDFSRDGKQLVFAAPNRTLSVYDVTEKSLRENLEIGWTPTWLRLAPAGSTLAMVNEKETGVVVFDLASGQFEPNSLAHPGIVAAAAWSRDGQLLATGCHDNNVYVWDIKAREIVATCEGHRDRVLHVAFAHESDLLMSGGRDSSVRLWDARGGRQLLKANEIASGFSKDDRWLALSHPGVSVGRWEVASQRAYFTIPSAKTGATVYQLAYSPDGRMLACGSFNRGVPIFDTGHGREIARLDAHAKAVKFSSDGKSLFVGGYHAGIQRWPLRVNADQNQLIVNAPQTYAASNYRHSNMSLSDSCTMAVVNSSFRRATVFDLKQQKALHTLRAEDIRFHAISPDEKWIATGSWRGSGAKAWNAQSGELEKDLSERGTVRVAFSPDGRWLVACSPQEYQVWKVGDWQPQYKIPANGFVHSVAAFTADSRVMAVTLPDGVLLVDPANGKEFVRLIPPEQMSARSLAFSPNADQLALGTLDGFIHIWRLDQIRQQLAAMDLDWNAPDSNAAGVNRGQMSVRMPTWSASSVWSREFAPARAFDDSISTRWNSRRAETRGAWVAIRWPAKVAITGVTIRQAFDRIRGFRLQALGDQAEWRDVFVAEGDRFKEIARAPQTADPNDESVNPVFEIELPETIETTGFRLLVTDVSVMDRSSVSIREIEFRHMADDKNSR